MIANGLSKYQGKNILMLQGPVGPFFRRLSYDLKRAGANVHKVNFNGGDWFFYPTDCVAFTESHKEWPEFLEKLIKEKQIDSILLFGDCRRMHRVSCRIAERLKIEVGVFGEGYVRPDYLTLDMGGVNGHSSLPKDPEFYMNRSKMKVESALPVGQTIHLSSLYSVLYYTACIFLHSFFPKYTHHRPLKFFEALPFIRSFFRKKLYAFQERHIENELVTQHSKNFFLVPLQVYNDSQIIVHSNYHSNIHFIEEVITSFAENAPRETILVIKHHPMDRGHSDYRKLISEIAAKNNLSEDRWRYIHDQHLPTLLNHARGVVLVNSTVGLQAIHHSAPLKVCGKAIYDIEGLTYQGTLTNFWYGATHFTVNRELYERYREYVVTHTQLNGSIYKPLEVKNSVAGLVWPDQNREEIFAPEPLEIGNASQIKVS